MANPRQRRKSRSTTHKPVSQSRRGKKLLRKQPPIKGPLVLQEGWDKHKTVRQNYTALGLAHSFTPKESGGKEGISGNSTGDGPTDRGKIPRGFGRIVRDEKGEVVEVEMDDEEEKKWVLLGDTVEEEEIKTSSNKKKRTASRGEKAYLSRLLAAHGKDYSKMASDLKRNVEQYTEGELRRAVERAGL